MEHLPVELIYRVISFAQQSDQHIHVSLSQVNRFFRSLVNSSPLFWTKIDFAYPIPLISLYIERSAHLPLDVIADNGVSTFWHQARERQDRTLECLALLRPHRHRIHRLRVRDVDAQFWGLDMRDMSRVPQPRPDPKDNFLWCHLLCNLEVLDLEFADWFINSDLDFPPVTTLRKVRLCGFWSKAHPSLLPPQLESLALADCTARTTAVILDHLVNLSLIRCPATVTQAILQCISLPQLFSLTIHFASVHDPTQALPTNHVVDATGVELFTQAQPTVQKLDISAFHTNNTFLEDTLQRLPNIIHLRIASASLRDDQLLLLSVGSVNEVPVTRVLCRQLTSLTIENEFDITSGALRRIAESRHAASIPLTALILRGLDGTKVTADDIEDLDTYGITELVVDVIYADFSGESDEDLWSGSEEADSSEGDWMSGDEKVVAGGS
ncbi:hypothetical protein FRC00_013179 [Tulasnella sp. 408]|nr:hypothetical protein FRC00_013179 [Tulasnella sp. 408]